MDGTTLAREVLAYLPTEGIELSEDLGEVETVLRDRLMAVGARTLELHLEERKLGYEGSPSFRLVPAGATPGRAGPSPAEDARLFTAHRSTWVSGGEVEGHVRGVLAPAWLGVEENMHMFGYD